MVQVRAGEEKPEQCVSMSSSNISEKKIAVLGAGNMGAALVEGLALRCVSSPEQILVYDIDASKVNALVDRCGVRAAKNYGELLSESEIVIIAIKPQLFEKVLPELRSEWSKDAGLEVLVSIAAGVSLDTIKRLWGDSEVHYVRVMPNVAALVGEGMSAVCGDDPESVQLVVDACSVLGKTVTLPGEDLMHVATAVAGSGPAFVFAFAEAMIEGARREGLSEEVASLCTLQTIQGAAALMSQGEKTPGELREMVSSPQGTTVEGLAALEGSGFADVLGSAVAAATRRSRELMKG